MIVVDTNVLSEPLKPEPDLRVVAWLDAQHVETLYVTTLTLAELRYGVATLPAGRRREVLGQRLEDELIPLFAGRILSFDVAASASYARIQATARSAGRALPPMDALIAAVCDAHGHTLATRNVTDFAAAGIPLIDPWSSQAG